ncbi:MAG: rhomboid family intramembrane serine protease [Johnsonella sp.]|nr:rhomboid family intramembrane serine protease [Johnsonella sp.]
MPYRSGEGGRRKPALVNWMIIILNILIFLFIEAVDSTESAHTMLRYGAGNMFYIVEQKEYWRLLTSVFLHFGISHISNNMLVLFMLGDNMERALGHLKYAIFYLCCGVGANIASLFFHIDRYPMTVNAGASGAIFGVVGGLLWAVMRNRGRLEDLTTKRLIILLVLTLYFGFTSSGVDNAAHISGAIIGFLLSMILYRKPRRRMLYPEGIEFYSDQFSQFR